MRALPWHKKHDALSCCGEITERYKQASAKQDMLLDVQCYIRIRYGTTQAGSVAAHLVPDHTILFLVVHRQLSTSKQGGGGRWVGGWVGAGGGGAAYETGGGRGEMTKAPVSDPPT